MNDMHWIDHINSLITSKLSTSTINRNVRDKKVRSHTYNEANGWTNIISRVDLYHVKTCASYFFFKCRQHTSSFSRLDLSTVLLNVDGACAIKNWINLHVSIVLRHYSHHLLHTKTSPSSYVIAIHKVLLLQILHARRSTIR